MKKDLVQIIKDNPGCVAQIDNDCWWLYSAEEWEKTYESECEPTPLATDRDVAPFGNRGHVYGGDILQALAVIVGVRIESV